jgi:hypothetical protein
LIDAAGELAVSTIAVSEQLPFEVINVHPTYSVAKEKRILHGSSYAKPFG